MKGWRGSGIFRLCLVGWTGPNKIEQVHLMKRLAWMKQGGCGIKAKLNGTIFLNFSPTQGWNKVRLKHFDENAIKNQDLNSTSWSL